MSQEIRRLLLDAGSPGVVTRCRDFTRQALADWHWLPASAGESRAAAPGAGSPEAGGEGAGSEDAGSDDAGREEGAEAAEDVLLMVSELVSNACLHAGGPRELVLDHDSGRLRMEVGDASPVGPRLKSAADPALPGGHGLVVLARLSRTWGWEPYTDGRAGKKVWAEVPAPPTRRPRPPQPPPVSGLREGSSAGRRASG
ncbi:ATP-binding protein [Streptomyces sp. NPDC006326]|uniref:ATP-binding protein n=1 Tax=Streptomyces sp. NPDC006326 TaxID=3156752 RepID=UPI0033BEDE8F